MNYRISKYKPNQPTEIRAEDWTAISDVGRVYGGKVFSMQEYLAVEQRYCSCLDDIMSACGISALRITYLETSQKEHSWKVNMKLSSSELDAFCKACLREKCYGILENRSLRIDFGYDFYMHVRCRLSFSKICEIAKKHNLWAELWGKIPSGIQLRFEKIF